MMTQRAVLGVGLILLLAGCSSFFRDRANDYRMTTELAPLTLPPGQESRPIKPLYPIPPGPATKPEWSKKFEAPMPRPLVLSGTQTEPAPPTGAAPPPEKPVLTQDGNGYPVLSITGDFNAIWDRLDESLRAAKAKIEDRDQRVGLYYLELADADGKKAIYQLRVTRSQSAYILALQKDDDTLAPEAMTKTLFESIVSHWPSLKTR